MKPESKPEEEPVIGERSPMTLQECKSVIAKKFDLGSTLVTGHKSAYCEECAELYASQFKSMSSTLQEWVSVQERMPEIVEDGESKEVLCLGFKRSREGTETYEVMRWVKLETPDMLDHKGKPKEYGWSNRWWDTNPDGIEVHYWKPLTSPGPIDWT